MKNWVPVIRKHAPYRIEPAISKAQNVVHVWADTFQEKKSWGPFLEVVLDFHFVGAALLKTDSLTVLITYSFTVSFNILHVSYSIYNIIAHWHLPAPSTPIKWKPSLIPTASNK